MSHKTMTANNMHTLIRWTVADTAARDALSPTSDDLGKMVWVQDTNSYYILADHSSPTWVLLGVE